MALKPTIYKFRVSLTDLNRDYFDNFQLTVAQHPSETLTRLAARLIAFCHSAEPDLQFTKGLSSIEEPDIWTRSLTDDIEHWIEVGEPDSERIKKASRLSKKLSIYSFNTKSDAWWKQQSTAISRYANRVYQLDNEGVEAFAALMTRTMDVSVMLTGSDFYIEASGESVQVSMSTLFDSSDA
ncbi:hypothetical protein ST37_01400 (plasmid) [Vibrio sp. qd031]|uniref:YaeQ family protein n=1 Tax=Vibrio sp. qd031 TaxID=1603038 RepID=UPI000A122192|nr:YaeQ family protein [Vibrio sp. qd031]ORT52464.1 hypothetical protein ST37_01400 [Vibrio sp. qd031]